MSDDTGTDLATDAVHSGENTDELSSVSGDVVSPIHLATHHEMDAPGESAHGYKYSRFGNPTREALETRLADLTGASEAIAFSSGTAAIATAGLALCDPGDHIVAFDGVYGGTRLLFEEFLRRKLGVDIEYVDANYSTTTTGVCHVCGDEHATEQSGELAVLSHRFSSTPVGKLLIRCRATGALWATKYHSNSRSRKTQLRRLFEGTRWTHPSCSRTLSR